MLASELIAGLQGFIETYGDLNVQMTYNSVKPWPEIHSIGYLGDPFYIFELYSSPNPPSENNG